MSKLRGKQLFDVLLTSGSQYLTGSLTVSNIVYATYFSGSGAFLTDIGAVSFSSPWLVTGDNLYTSRSFDTITASGSLQVISTGSAADAFLVKNNQQNLLRVSSSGLLQLNVFNNDPVGVAPNGAVYFTSASLFVGLG